MGLWFAKTLIGESGSSCSVNHVRVSGKPHIARTTTNSQKSKRIGIIKLKVTLAH